MSRRAQREPVKTHEHNTYTLGRASSMLPQDRNKQLGGNLPRQNEPTSLHGVTKVMEFCLGRLLLLTSRAIFQQVLFNSCPNRPMLVASPKPHCITGNPRLSLSTRPPPAWRQLPQRSAAPRDQPLHIALSPSTTEVIHRGGQSPQKLRRTYAKIYVGSFTAEPLNAHHRLVLFRSKKPV